ncbi:hypothetical protein LCGC14_0163950 [marine sediment metagenome]|uniref:Uncharacterized protein n=1 Tax=marine sediment metagenome TaxID=412755 RepID=A0A0F9XCM9_9ZZZZ
MPDKNELRDKVADEWSHKWADAWLVHEPRMIQGLDKLPSYVAAALDEYAEGLREKLAVSREALGKIQEICTTWITGKSEETIRCREITRETLAAMQPEEALIIDKVEFLAKIRSVVLHKISESDNPDQIRKGLKLIQEAYKDGGEDEDA